MFDKKDLILALLIGLCSVGVAVWMIVKLLGH